MTPYLILAGWGVFILVLWALLRAASDEDDAMEELTAECPYCFEWYMAAGAGNIFRHVMYEHPESTIARRIHEELAA